MYTCPLRPLPSSVALAANVPSSHAKSAPCPSLSCHADAFHQIEILTNLVTYSFPMARSQESPETWGAHPNQLSKREIQTGRGRGELAVGGKERTLGIRFEVYASQKDLGPVLKHIFR